MTSLRTRAVTAGVLWAFVTISLGLAGLGSFMNAQTQSRFADALSTRHTQAVVAISNYSQLPQLLDRGITDPAYLRPFSGEYWQIEDADGAIYVSTSLVDTLLPRPATDPGSEGVALTRQIAGPADDRLLSISEWVSLDNGSRWHVQVASSLSSLTEDQIALRRSLLTAFAVVAGVGVLGALVQVALMLRPINALRQEVAARWDEGDGLEVESYPVEVAPLVADINALMDRNHDIIRRSRRQAADLAHAVKTPSAVVRNELDALASQGVEVSEAVSALDRLDGQLQRSFARMRADNSEDAIGVFTDLDVALGRMERAFKALSGNAGKTFAAQYKPGMRIRMDQNDFEEVLGNLLDNAMKWSRSQLRLTATQGASNRVRLVIEDDGPGIPDDKLEEVIASGYRLDQSVPGTGLGLAIAADLIVAYGGAYTLGRSDELGGFAFIMELPVAGAAPRIDRPQKDPPTPG